MKFEKSNSEKSKFKKSNFEIRDLTYQSFRTLSRFLMGLLANFQNIIKTSNKFTQNVLQAHFSKKFCFS